MPIRKKRALITGISGQDGSFLSELLLSKGYEVFGILRRHSVAEHQDARIEHLGNRVTTVYGDLLDIASLEKAIKLSRPHEIYNLAAQSHVRISFDIPQATAQANASGVINLLETYKNLCPKARFYQASSSEMFGNSRDKDGFQRESTPFTPVSPYGCAKVFGYNIVRNYRNAYGLFACNGILFNHESPRRGSNFVTSKVVKAAVDIKRGRLKKLVMGNLDSHRDWGHSRDYCRAIHAIINHSKPDDFVVATGQTHSVRQMCDYVFGKLGMDYRDYVVQDRKFMRPEELRYLRGDASKAKRILKWKPEITFASLMDEMIEFWSRAA
jgi:GDPmannose 4,6-dehydratase